MSTAVLSPSHWRHPRPRGPRILSTAVFYTSGHFSPNLRKLAETRISHFPSEARILKPAETFLGVVTGIRFNQLSYHPSIGKKGFFPDDLSFGQEGIEGFPHIAGPQIGSICRTAGWISPCPERIPLPTIPFRYKNSGKMSPSPPADPDFLRNLGGYP